MRRAALAAGIAAALAFSACERTPTAAVASGAATAACGPAQVGSSPHPDMAFVAGGSFTMGSDTAFPEEAPASPQSVGDFWIDRTEVTNAQFAEFVAATGYVTLAERGVRTAPALDAPVVAGSAVFAPNADKLSGSPRNAEYWWRFVPGASWHAPEGPGSSLEGRRAQHPVVHIAYEDALAYAQWRGRSLPTEAQFEFRP
jgi:formylglycine-generating enzyme